MCSELTVFNSLIRASPELVQRLGQALTRLKKKLKEAESENVELATRLGVATFEKNQIINILDATNYGVVITDIQDNIIRLGVVITLYGNATSITACPKNRHSP